MKTVEPIVPRIPPIMTGGRSYEQLRDRFMELLLTEAKSIDVQTFETPDLYDSDRVSYIIPPITDVCHRDDWHPSGLYIVKEGIVAIGRVFYTRTSGEYLIEELTLGRGDIFGEFEVPLSIIGSPALWATKLPPRFNMTYGAWASGPALNWAMAYPRYILRDRVVPESAKVAVHPFYIKSKNIRPHISATVVLVPIDAFEDFVSSHPEAMTWFLMNVLWKNRLYFEPPAQGYGRSPADIIARLFIRILAFRIRHGIVVREDNGNRTECRTFIGPTEWIKYGFGPYMADLKEVLIEIGGNATHDPVVLPVFDDELSKNIKVTYRFLLKDLDDAMLEAMDCSRDENERENRYGLLTGIKIECRDLDRFKRYLLEKGE